MRNVTISVSEEVARWARIRAAEKDTSVSAMLSAVLQDMMRNDQQYTVAMEAFFESKPSIISDGSAYPSRDSVHER